MTTKQQIEKAVGELPDDATLDDALSKLEQLSENERGRSHSAGGGTSANAGNPPDEWEAVSQKEKMIRAIASLPDDADFDDGMDAIVLLIKIGIGLAQVAAGQTVPQEEVKARLAKWRQ